ncbi:NADH dehydrogenase [ubiquinone] 1 beta subcomplex subunit 10 [Belonocnema kinseyi]|uniref:NADH dehydrogenase [ubiquinone] 1 beta subcomplex subunit 10 n=1 Tax=Belonocnema kinseyi TaxID=2817044 RepID=UPI00143DDD92|nr:NADH dehydrogenase [ubiquinone] 1 beta subcomplex subunit 10 [Belonocnema kinseyi]
MEGRNSLERFVMTMYNMVDGPVTFFREKIVEPNQKDYPWYHQKFRRVPTVDQCYTDDRVCVFEADEQFRRDKLRDSEILDILRHRYENCVLYQGEEKDRCQPLLDMYEEATGAWFSKYGDLGVLPHSKGALMKQKHRMIWERRHGPIGSTPKDPTPYWARYADYDFNYNRGKRTPDSIEIPGEEKNTEKNSKKSS